ncbi:LapA family protein [Gloeothece verrucosa]|uniref:Lipopolysaccharide assembly protein A domain-containing protein n=1 Tax=Gloeothece verrucosa (strain PCC 7822) TaxID=497965 RepID=E0UFI5_GLOV7|nr:LapA family protein [Gloeothece verrucosa]ADN16679.1 conserved hypothetical protein [Gloeothece verrucosa PCC 7822]
MQVINLMLIFALGLAIALFSLENTQVVSVNIIPGLSYKLPLSICIVVTMGIGAVLAWLLMIWMKLQGWVIQWQKRSALKAKDQKIKELLEDVEQLQAQVEQPTRYLTTAEAINEDNTQTAEIIS